MTSTLAGTSQSECLGNISLLTQEKVHAGHWGCSCAWPWWVMTPLSPCIVSEGTRRPQTKPFGCTVSPLPGPAPPDPA